MTDIVHRLHPFRCHITLGAAAFVNDPQRLIDSPLFQLLPRKTLHLFTIRCIQWSCLILIGNHIRIQYRRFFIIQIISMHKIQIYRFRKFFFEMIIVDRHHIILIQLRNLKIGFDCFFIPFKAIRSRSVSADEQCTNCSENHGIRIHRIHFSKDPIQILVVISLLRRKICHIKRNVLGE